MAYRVVCRAAPGKGSRNRGGRNWPEGETLLPDEQATPELLASLRGDSRFTVVEDPAAPVSVPLAPAPEAPAVDQGETVGSASGDAAINRAEFEGGSATEPVPAVPAAPPAMAPVNTHSRSRGR